MRTPREPLHIIEKYEPDEGRVLAVFRMLLTQAMQKSAGTPTTSRPATTPEEAHTKK